MRSRRPRTGGVVMVDSVLWRCACCGGEFIGGRTPDDLCTACIAAALTRPACRCRNVAGENCPRPVTQKGSLCDVCRDGCMTLRSTWQGERFLLGAHMEVARWEELTS